MTSEMIKTSGNILSHKINENTGEIVIINFFRSLKVKELQQFEVCFFMKNVESQ